MHNYKLSLIVLFRYMCGIVMQNLGLFRRALEYYDDTLKRKPDHVSWYTKQITLYCHHHLGKKE
jgi:hypothetical protein